MKFLGSMAKFVLPAFVLFLSHALPPPTSCHAAASNVLILHSYHQTIPWTDSIMQGMMEGLSEGESNLDIHVEYMDTLRLSPEAAFDDLETFFRAKYKDQTFSLILLSDNNALNFILQRREGLFPGVPIVFCGINGFKRELLQGQTGITGITADIDIRGTIELALQIKPEIKEFLVINDRSATGLLHRAKYEEDIAGLKATKLRFELFDDFTLPELETRLSELPVDAAVLVMRFPFDITEDPLTPHEFLNIICDYSKLPVFTLWGTDIDTKVLGGVMVAGRSQGRMAARYGLRILGGEPVSALPVVMESPNVAMIDYRQLDRLGIAESAIPPNVLVLFRPEGLLDKYRLQILGSVLFVTALVIIIVILFINTAIRKKTEKALLKSEQKLSSALEMAHLGHWEYNTATRRFSFNDQFYAIFRTTGALAGGYTMPLTEYTRRFVHPDDTHIVERELRKAIEASDPGYSCRIEHRMRYADGTMGYMAVRGFVEKDDHGHTEKVYGVAQDITELRQAEESIIRSEERWRLILQTAMDGFSLVNRKGRFIEVNEAFCRILGYRREELLAMHVADISVNRDLEQIEKQIQKTISVGAERFETLHRRKDGKIIDTEISLQYRPTEGGLLAAFLRDVTERKHIEARLRQGQKMEAVGTLAGGIAHDFNNILQPMLGFCELLKSDLPPDTPEQGFVDGILDAAMRAKALVNQILTFSRQEDEEAKPIRLQPVIKEALKLLRASIPKTIDIQHDIEPDCGIVFADPTQIYQIVMNLCTNAYHAMEEKGGRLYVALNQVHLEKNNPVFPEMPPGEYALMKVSDTGTGIPQTILNRIFDPYFTTKEKAKGTGLGLSIVQGIVKRYRGDIRIYSETGRGTEIHVYLPIVAPENGDRHPEESTSIEGGSEKILLVDDEMPVAQMIHRLLERLGYRVTTRLGSMDALAAFRAGPDDFDLVITDLTMPGMTGIELAGEIKKIREDIPMVLCTGFSEQVPDDKLKAAGIRAKLAKPVITKALAETVRDVLAAGEGSGGP